MPMNKLPFMAAIAIIALLISLVGLQVFEVANANPFMGNLPEAPIMSLPVLNIAAPSQDGCYKDGDVVLSFSVTKIGESWFSSGRYVLSSSAISNISYTLDGTCTPVFSINRGMEDGLGATTNYSFKLGNLDVGRHVLTVDVAALHYYGGAMFAGTSPKTAENNVSASVTFEVTNTPLVISDDSAGNMAKPDTTNFTQNTPTPPSTIDPTPEPSLTPTHSPSPTPESLPQNSLFLIIGLSAFLIAATAILKNKTSKK